MSNWFAVVHVVNFLDIKPTLSSTLRSVLLGWDLLDSLDCNVHC